MKTLKQKRLIFYRHYSIQEDGVKFIANTINGYVERTIKFEDIEFDEQIFDEKAPLIRVLLACSLLFNILFIIATISSGGVKNAFESLFLLTIVFLAAGTVVFFIKKERNKFIVGQKNLVFWYENKYKAKVDSFIEEIKIAKKQYILNRYLKISDWEDEYMIKGKLNWLHQQKYISEEELQERLLELEHRKIIKGK